MIISESVRALFERATQPPSWRVIQILHGALIVGCSIFAVMSTERWIGLLNAFLVGSSFASVGYIGGVMRYHRLVEDMREQMKPLQPIFDAMRGGVVTRVVAVPLAMMDDDDEDERPTIN